MKRSETFAEFAKAFSKFQAEVTNPKMTADNPHLKSKYAPLAEVFNTVRPILAKYGLSVFQDVATQDDKAVITTTIIHESGEFLESSPLFIPAARGGKPVDAQGIGSAISYGKRYQLQASIGVAADSDDDGENISSDNQYIPTNMVGKSSAENEEAALKVKYQLVMGQIEGFADYVKNLRDKGHDNAYINAALDHAHKVKNKSA